MAGKKAVAFLVCLFVANKEKNTIAKNIDRGRT
jgi:hypothetical protein